MKITGKLAQKLQPETGISKSEKEWKKQSILIEKVNLKFLKALDDDPLRRKPDIYLAKKELNWEPKIMFKEGLAITREYFEKKLIFEKKLNK